MLYCATEGGRGFFVWHRLNFKNLYQTNQPIGLHSLYIILRIVLWWYLNNWNLNIIYLESFSAKHQYFVLFETIFSFSKLHGFEKASLNTFSSVLKTTSVTHRYIAITSISMLEVPLARLKPQLLLHCDRSSTNEVPC